MHIIIFSPAGYVLYYKVTYAPPGSCNYLAYLVRSAEYGDLPSTDVAAI